MDPNATLAIIRSELRSERPDRAALKDACSALAGWLVRGGFQPIGWNRYERKRFNRLCRRLRVA